MAFIKTLSIHPLNPEIRKINQIIADLENGEIVAYPTDSSPAIGCDPFRKKTVIKLCRLKNIDPKRADLTFLCSSISQISTLTKQLDKELFKVLKAHLPGPFTFILPAGRQSTHFFKNKKLTIGVRIPDHPILQAVLSAFGRPILSTTIDLPVDDNLRQMWEIMPFVPSGVATVIDDGRDFGQPTTVVSYHENVFEIIRQGGLPFVP